MRERTHQHGQIRIQRAGAPARDLDRSDIDVFTRVIPHEFARRNLVLCDSAETVALPTPPADTSGPRPITIACAPTTTRAVLHNLSVHLARPVVPVVQSPERLAIDIDRAYARARLDGPVPEPLGDDTQEDITQSVEALVAAADQDLLATSGKAPVVRFVDSVILEAIGRRASDIHIQPLADRTLVRYRIDGVLHTAHVLPAAATAPIVSRVKVMGRMDIAERRIPQDGRASVTIGRAGIEPETPDGPSCGRAIDLRLSSLPTSHGERIVLRLLDARRTRDLGSFASLGMPAPVQRRFLTCASRSSGMILVTGPTGSGKTTTLYATLHRIAAAMRPEPGRQSAPPDPAGGLNVMTIEDPIEYELSSAGIAVSQAQVNTKKGVTFARGLRHILRQDPDVVMVGEIRDEETARIAIQASLTGHLVLATLHTNDSAGAPTRLVDLGIEPYLVGASLSCVLAQRLVRRIHPSCSGTGCAACHGSGFHGRVGVFELLMVDEQIRSIIASGADASRIRDASRGRAMRCLRDAGLDLVTEGVTTRQEVERVVHIHDDAADDPLILPVAAAPLSHPRHALEPTQGDPT